MLKQAPSIDKFINVSTPNLVQVFELNVKTGKNEIKHEDIDLDWNSNGTA
jgi:hypothetical protein